MSVLQNNTTFNSFIVCMLYVCQHKCHFTLSSFNICRPFGFFTYTHAQLNFFLSEIGELRIDHKRVKKRKIYLDYIYNADNHVSIYRKIHNGFFFKKNLRTWWDSSSRPCLMRTFSLTLLYTIRFLLLLKYWVFHSNNWYWKSSI